MSLINTHPGNGLTSLAYALALTVTLAHEANAQTQVRELHITLMGEACARVDQVWVVINGRDDARLADEDERPKKAEKGRLKCYWKLPGIKRHDVDISFFSLRLDRLEGIPLQRIALGRTPCRRAERIDEFNILVEFTTRGEADAHDLKIGGPSVEYARELSATRDGDVRCSEKQSVPATLLDFQYDIEELRLRLFQRNTVACGLSLNHVAGLDKVKKNAKVPVTPKQLESEVVKQGFKGKSCYAPTFTPVEALKSSLENKGLDITVK